MKKRHYILITSLIIIPLVPHLVFLATKQKQAAESTTPQAASLPTSTQHIIAELLHCRNLNNDIPLTEVLKDALDSLEPPLQWRSSQITAATHYAAAFLEHLYCILHTTAENSLRVDIYSDTIALDTQSIIAALEKECLPAQTKQRKVQIAA